MKIDIVIKNRIRLIPIICNSKGFKLKWLFFEIETNL